MQESNKILINSDLDEQMPDYVRAELAGDDVSLAYPIMHKYVTTSEHARELYDFLQQTEKLAVKGLLPEIERLTPPDLSFLSDAE